MLKCSFNERLKKLVKKVIKLSLILDGANEFIREGERVIWFDTYSEFQQLGTVAAVFEYSPCAIVKFVSVF